MTAKIPVVVPVLRDAERTRADYAAPPSWCCPGVAQVQVVQVQDSCTPDLPIAGLLGCCCLGVVDDDLGRVAEEVVGGGGWQNQSPRGRR